MDFPFRSYITAPAGMLIFVPMVLISPSWMTMVPLSMVSSASTTIFALVKTYTVWFLLEVPFTGKVSWAKEITGIENVSRQARILFIAGYMFLTKIAF